MMASLCLAVFAFLLIPLPPRAPGPFLGGGVSVTSTGVAAPEGLAETSSKCPSPGEEAKLATLIPIQE